MNAIALYTRYALRSFIRGRSRSLFGAFCVAVGIASVVALGLVGANFHDAMTGNAQKLARSDVSVQSPWQGGFTPSQYRYFERLKAEGKLVDYTSIVQADALLKTPHGDQSKVVVGSLMGVEPRKFPFYDTVIGDRPQGVPLKSLLTSPNDAVVSHDVFNMLHLRIGSRLAVAYRFGGTRSYTVTGVVPDNAPDPSFGSGLFPEFAMVDRTSMSSYMQANNTAARTVYMKTAGSAQAIAVKQDIERHFGGLINPKTAADVQKESLDGAAGMDKFFRIMGLVAVVIGGIGIINTMLVAARRRMGEIAVLKSLGMKGRQVILVFTIESFLLGAAGTALGIVLGLGASAAVNAVTQNLAGFAIPWTLHPEPLVAAALVGIVGTVIFSYLPVLQASRSRPIAALRDESDAPKARSRFRRFASAARHPVATAAGIRRVPGGIVNLPKRQGLRTALVVILLASIAGYLGVLYTGLVSGTQTVVIGALAGIGTLVVAGILTNLFVVTIWAISRLPSMGRLSLRMAFRSMGTQKRRLSSTLLALTIGILAIGSVTILAQNVKHVFSQAIEQRQNYNVLVQAPHDPALLRRIDAAVFGLPGISHQHTGAAANQLTLAAVNGKSVDTVIRERLATRKATKDSLSQALSNDRGVAGYDVRAVRGQYVMDAGRNLKGSDAGTNHIVLSADVAGPLGIKVGGRLTYAEGAQRVPFTVVGVVNSTSFMMVADTEVDQGYMARTGLTISSPSHNSVLYLDIKHANLKGDVSVLRQRFPNALVLDLSNFSVFLSSLDKLALFPEIIAVLALFAGVVIIANTVALAMLERRREIAVMKAVGARRRTILGFLVVENAIVGFLGALVGVRLAMLATMIVDQQIFKFAPSYDWNTIAGLLALGVVLAVVASLLTAYPASGEKPMRALRYE